MLRLAFDFIITWRETRTRPNAYDIFNYLQENTRDKLSINKINWFGRILRKLNIPKKTSTRGTLYHVTKLK